MEQNADETLWCSFTQRNFDAITDITEYSQIQLKGVMLCVEVPPRREVSFWRKLCGITIATPVNSQDSQDRRNLTPALPVFIPLAYMCMEGQHLLQDDLVCFASGLSREEKDVIQKDDRDMVCALWFEIRHQRF